MEGMPVYMDHHATTPCDPAVVEAMLPYLLQDHGNASSRQHLFGQRASVAVNRARSQVAALIGALPEEVYFTSGATESVNLAIKGMAAAHPHRGRRIVTVETEHSAVLDSCRRLEDSGYPITRLPVDADGRLAPERLREALAEGTLLACVMLANNETGVIHDIPSMADVCREKGVPLFTDATQAAGKIPIDVQSLGVDLLCLSAHKMYGPKGVGALYVRRATPRLRLIPQLDGGGHEQGLRSGTLNVPGIAGFGRAAELAAGRMETEMPRVGAMRDFLEAAVTAQGEVFVNGGGAPRLPTVSNLAFRYLEGQAFLGAVCRRVAVSAGSACSSASMEPSHVLTAMGVGRDLAFASLRFSLGRTTTEEEVRRAAEALTALLQDFRSKSPVWSLSRNGALAQMPEWAHPSTPSDG